MIYKEPFTKPGNQTPEIHFEWKSWNFEKYFGRNGDLSEINKN
jgi:hypothetical protein